MSTKKLMFQTSFLADGTIIPTKGFSDINAPESLSVRMVEMIVPAPDNVAEACCYPQLFLKHNFVLSLKASALTGSTLRIVREEISRASR